MKNSLLIVDDAHLYRLYILTQWVAIFAGMDDKGSFTSSELHA